MSLLGIFNQNTEKEPSNKVGSFECDKQNLVKTFMNLMGFMGMSNPGKLVSTSTKAVKITKKGSKFTLQLNMFKPPVKISWTELTPIQQIEAELINAVNRGLSISFVNQVKVENNDLIQLGVF